MDREKLISFIEDSYLYYLGDRNINSIGLVEKTIDDKKVLHLSFTVNDLNPEFPPSKTFKEILEPIKINGNDDLVPTEVIERKYSIKYSGTCDINLDPNRTGRLNPFYPGASIGNKARPYSAGTIAAVVFGKTDKAAYVLSNWHVLVKRGRPSATKIVQPGQLDQLCYSDTNEIGRLKDCHLGTAGDGAIASIYTDVRGFDRKIYELDVIPGEPETVEQEDKVVKSSRSTGVTHGIVTRTNVFFEMRYGRTTKYIKGFEIGPDPNHPTCDNEISLNHDSGNLWLLKDQDDKITNSPVGLHFAGESTDRHPEHAVACYIKSIMDKLNVTFKIK